jgi:aryl-alcohol dehydrogenase-like predicted oxidoreductase
VSRYAFGGMTFGGDMDQAAAHEMLDVYVDASGTLIDTADNYGSGTSEHIVGHPGTSLTPAYPRTAIDASLSRPGVDQVDLCQLHGPDDEHRVDESPTC